MEAETCRCCKHSTSDTDSYRLWDGNTYCRSCVEQAGPELADYAREHASLRDNPVFPAWRVAGKAFLFLWLIMTVLFGWIGVLEGFRQQSFGVAIAGVAILQIFILPVSCLFVAVIYFAYRFANWEIEVSDGMVWLLGSGRQISLSSCQWFVGKTTQATRPPFLPRVDAVLLATRLEGVRDEAVTVVSVKPEMVVVWIQFLTLAGVRRRTLWERRSVAKRIAFVVAGVAAVMASVIATVWLGMGCGQLLERLDVPKGVSDAIMFAFFIPGCVFVGLGLAILWPWSALPRVPSRRSREEQRQIRRQYFGPMVSSIVSFTYLFRGDVIGFLIYFAMWLAFAALFGLVVGYYVATREYATTEESMAARKTIEVVRRRCRRLMAGNASGVGGGCKGVRVACLRL